MSNSEVDHISSFCLVSYTLQDVPGSFAELYSLSIEIFVKLCLILRAKSLGFTDMACHVFHSLNNTHEICRFDVLFNGLP